MKARRLASILSLIGLATGILNGYYTFVIKPITPIIGISFMGFVTSVFLIFNSRYIIEFLNSLRRHKYRKLFVESWVFGIWFVFMSLVGMVYLVFVSYTFLPTFLRPVLNIVFNILPLLLIAYTIYIFIRLILFIGGHIEQDGSVRKTLRLMWRDRSAKK